MDFMKQSLLQRIVLEGIIGFWIKSQLADGIFS